MPSSLKDIYNALREDQQFSQTKDYGTFAKRMNERGYSQMIYNNLKTAGASLPDVNTFRKRLGLKDWSAPSTKPVAKSKAQVTPSYADYSATNYNPSSASQGNGVKDKYRYPGLSVPMNSGGTEDTASSGNESALVRSLRKTDSRKSQPSMRKPIGKVMVENRDEETRNLRSAASEIANEGEKPAYNLGDETTSQYLSKRKSDVAKEHDKVRSVSEAVWDNASKVAGEEFNDYIRERNEMNFTNVVRELAKGSSPSRMSEDNWEVGTEAMASHLRNHDLEKLSDAAWNALGESGQKDLINDYYSKILQQYPHADHNEAYEEATKMARAESDNQMYQTAVSKNAPKDVADFFFRKAARTNTVGNIMEANARIKAGTRGDMDARDEADARYEQDHKVAGIGGMVAGFAADPLTAVSGGAGSATAKGAAALAGKAFGQAAVRKFGTTLGGKILTGAAAGMGNLGTLEAGSNVAEQLRQGGWNDEEGKFHEGFSEGQVLKQGLHGAGMGALTGVVSPVIGNVADKAVRATSSTVGKIGIRAGEVGSSILAEGTIFSIPEWMDGKRDKMDVWTDNLAQMAGMKVQGGFKTVANTLAGLHGNAKTGFRERINGILDGNRQDLALTKDERAELEQGGYTDLKQLTDDAVAFKSKKAAPKDGKTVTTTDDGKDVPINRFEELMADKNISEAARAKMYYYLTGHTLPMSTVTGGSMSTTKDADGKVTGYTVESTGYNGVITRRHFTDRKSADREMDRVHRQAELNNIGIGERLYDEKTVKDGKPVEDGSAKLRSDIMDEYGIDVNEAYKKSYDKRSEEEQEAIDAYSDRLYDVTRNADPAEDTDPMGLSVAEREGADIVEENHLGTETPQTEAVQSAVTELRQAQTVWAEAMKSDTSLAEGFKAAQEKGIGMVEAYEWMLEQGYGTEESLAPLADVIGASVKVASMWRGTKESIEKTTQDHVSTWQWEGTDFGQGEVTEPTMLYVTDKNGHRLIVKSGHIKFDAKGNAIEGDMIICLDEATGDMVHPSVKDVKFQGTESAKDYADRYRQRLQEINSKGYEALQVTPAEAEGKAEDKTAPEETSEPGLPFSDETPKTEPSEVSQDIPAEGEPGTPDNGKIEGNYDKDSGIPLDEEGEPLYEQVSKEQTVEDIFGKLDDANLARDYAKHKVSEAEKKLKSVSGNAPKMGTKINEYARKKAEYEAKVKEAQASVDYWKSVVEDIEKLTHTTDEELAEQKRELDGTAAKEEMKDNHEADVPDSGVALAASVLADAKVTPESLKKETGYETKDLNKFVGMLAKKENGGVDLASLAEKLVEMDEQYNNRFFGGDAQEARNALLEALGQAKTRGELRALARPDEAKAIKAREEQRDKAYHDAYGMSYKEYLDFAEQEMAHLIGDMAHFDEEKYLQDYAAEITKQIDKEHGTGIEGHESAGEEPVHGTGSEVLSGEGVDDRGGSGSVEGHGEGKEEVRGGDRADAALERETSGGVEETHPIEGMLAKADKRVDDLKRKLQNPSLYDDGMKRIDEELRTVVRESEKLEGELDEAESKNASDDVLDLISEKLGDLAMREEDLKNAAEGRNFEIEREYNEALRERAKVYVDYMTIRRKAGVKDLGVQYNGFNKRNGVQLGTRKAQVNPKQFYDPKDELYPQMAGVYYENGCAVATNGHVLLATKTEYPKEYEGKTINAKGNVVDPVGRPFPDWPTTIPQGGEEVDASAFIDAVGRMVAEDKGMHSSKQNYGSFVDLGHGKLIMMPAAKALADVARKAKNVKVYFCEGLNGNGVVCIEGDGTLALAVCADPIANKKGEDTKKADNETSYHYSVASAEPSSVEHSPAEVVEHVAKVAEKTGGKVEQVNSVDEIANEKVKALSGRERVLRDAVVDRMLDAGLDVSMDTENGQRVLDETNGDVRMEAKHHSESAEKRRRVLGVVDEATAFVTGKDIKDVRAERMAREAEYKAETRDLYEKVLSGKFDDVTLQRINEYLDHVTPNNEYGRPLSKRLPPEVVRRVRKGERTSEIDVLFSRICESAVAANERTRAEGKRRIEEKKKELLKGWAIATGNWHTSVEDFTHNTEPIGSGKDSVVYLSDDGKSVIKVSAGKDNIKKFRPDIDAVTLFNHIFRNSPYRILGYGEVDGKFVKFLEQPFVDFSDSTPLSAEERVAYMERMGFKPMNDEKTAFSNGKFVVADLQGNNIVKDKAGNIRVIDADVKLHTKDAGGNYEYPAVETDFPTDTGISYHRVYHGSSADFDRFDHSHMGEGEGAQAYGWGTYVTEVEGIGKAYAEVARRNAGVRREGLLSNINRAKAQLPFMREGEYKTELERQIAEWEEESAKPSDGRLLYTVEIPDDNGQNYLDWKEKPTKQQKETIIRALMDFNRIDVDDIREMLKMPSEYSDDDVLRTEVGAHVLGNSGSDLYHSLSVYFGNDEMASKFLAEAGFAGIKYPADYQRGGRADGAKNYVIFNEANAKIVDKVRYFRTANGVAYGFTVGGKIYIDPRIAGSDTPIHEYAHLWASALRACNPEEWKNVVALMKDAPIWDEVKERYPDLKTDDEIADEVLAHYSGRRGAERLREEARKIADGNGDVFEKAEAISALECVKQALQKFWKGVCDFLHIHYTSAEEVADRVMKDLLDGVDPRKMAKANDELRMSEDGEIKEIVAKSKADGTYMKAPNGTQSKLSSRQWVQVRTKAFKGWFGDWDKAIKWNAINEMNATPIEYRTVSEEEAHKAYDNIGVVENVIDGKNVDFVKSSFGKIVRHKGVDTKMIMDKLDVLFREALPLFFEKEVAKDGHKDHSSNFVGYHHYLNKIKIGGKEYYVRFTAQEIKTNPAKKKADDFTPYQFHNTSISDIDIYESTESSVESPGTFPATGTDRAHLDAKLANFLKEAKESYESSSKVVDENGEPRVVYHQTNSTVWVNRETGDNYEDLDWKEKDYWQNDASEEEWEDTWEEQDFYAFDNKTHGRRSVEMPAFFFAPEYDEHHEYGDRTVAVFLNIKNPAVNPTIENRGVYDDAGEKAMQKLIDEGYDGFIREYDGTIEEINAFYPNQIKSATENVGTFDAENNDIRYLFMGEKANGEGRTLLDAAEHVAKVAEKTGGKPKPQSPEQARENHSYPKQPLKERTRKACESVAKELGMDIEWVDHLEANGEFTTKDENGNNLPRPLIRIARDAENPLTTVFGHEGIHAVRKLSDEAYQSLVKAAMSVVGDAEWQKRFDATKKRYKKQNLTDAEIAEEVVADIVGEMITDRDMTEKIASRLSHPVLSALRDVAHKIWEAIKAFVGKGTTLNEQEQAVKDFTDTIERAFVEAKKKAKEREVYANEAPAPSAERVSEVLSQNAKDYDPVSVPWGKGDLIGDNATPTRYSSRASIEGAGLKPNTDDGGRVTYSFGGKKFDKDHPVTPNDLKRIHSPFMSLVKYCEEAGTLKDADVVISKYCDLLNLFLKKGDKGFDALSDEFAWSGEALFKTVSNNSDAQYKKSVDITRLCKKNEAVIYAICELQKRQGYGATPGQILDIYEATNDQGYQVPCPVCYVFSRYVANGQYATALISGQKFFGKYLKDPSTMTPKQREKYVADWCARLAEVKAWKAKNSKAIAQAKSDIITILQQVDAISEDITSGKLKGDALTVAKQHIRALDKLYRDALNLTAKASLDGWITNIAIMKKGGKKIAEESESSDTEEALSVDPKDYDVREDSWKAYPEDMALDLRKTAEAEREYPGIVRFRRTRGAAAGKAIQFAADNKIGELVELLGKSGIEDKNKNYSALQKAFAETDEATRNKYLKEAQTNIRNAVIYAARQSLRGGVRQWSWSDNIERLMPDVFINLLQEHMLGAAVQAYSKQLEGIEMVAAMNGYINGSLMGKGIGIREVSADYTDGPVYYEPRDGKYYTLEFDSVVGVEPFSRDGKLGLFDLNKMYDRAGNILVGMSNTHIRAALADPRIFFVIPWHASGANNHVLMQMYKFLGIDTTDLSRNATDYTKTQEDKRFSASDNVTSSDREVWEEHNCNDKYKCGIGTIESGTVCDVDGKQVIRLSEGQKRYRALRDAILTTDMRKPITTLTDAQRKKLTEEREAGSSVTESERIAELETERQRNLKEIENDEFLSQVLRKQERLHEMGTTMEKEDCNHIYPYEYWDEASTFDTADVNGERYLEYCRRMGFRPKFCGIADGKRGDTGNFVNDKGYWKLLIDRRMYKCDGNFQDLTPVTVDGFSTDLIDRDVIEKRVPVTRVANGDETNGIVDQVQEAERQRGLNSKQFVPQVNYDMSFDKASERYQKTSDRESILSNTRKYIEEKNMKKAEARAKAKADHEKRKAKGTKYSLREGAASTDEAENENIYLSLRNKKGKEYNDTVTELARERSAKRNAAEVDGSLSDKNGESGVQERSTQRGSGERQENVGLLPDAIRIIAEDGRRVATEDQSSGDRRDGTERGRGVLPSDGDGVFQGEDSRRRSSIENKVEEWAKANGLYVDEGDVRNASDGENVFKHGGESRVYLSKDGKTITKFIKYWTHDRADLGEYIDFVDEYNKVFPESRYEVIGVSRDNRGQLRAVVEQPYTEGERVSRTDWIKDGRYEKVKEYFEGKGFKETGFGVFSNGDTVVSDIHHGNVVFRNGEPIVIDADINPLGGLRGSRQGHTIQGPGGLSNIINGLGRLRDSVLRADMDEINQLIEDTKKADNETSHHYSVASAESSSVEHSPAEVVGHVAKVAEKTGGKVEQVNFVDEIANEQVKADIEAGKKVQGWYDEKTTKVYLYMPNIHDRYTAERVVWHETVGHKGMRGLLGDEGFKQYMKGLWYDLDNPVNAELRQYVRDRMAKDHLSMYDAIEEFIADAAEKGMGTAGFWNNVKNKVSDVLHEIGYRISPNVKDVQYMLWLAKNVQKNPNDPVWKMRAEAAKWKIDHSDMHLSEERGGEIADTGSHKSLDEMTDAEIGRETDCAVHYSTAPSTATEIDLYNRAVGNVNAMLKESYQDSMNSLTELMKVLIPGMKRVEDVRATLNPRMMENLMAGRISAKGRKFANQEMKRLDRAYVGVLDAFNGKNTEERMREASLYMIEKHGLERNRVFYVRDKIAKERESNSMFADQLQQDWNVKKKELGDKLRNGQIDLKEYYKQMDEWIRGNVDRNYIASEHDYSGMHGMQGIANLRDAYDDAGAIAHVMDCEAKMENNKNGSVSELWSATKDATNFSIHEEYSSGYLSKDRYESLRDMFDWYVPLRKYDETTMEDVYTYIHGHVGSSNSIGMTVQKAKGRKSLSDVNILAQIGAMASGALYRGGSNEVRQAFARMVGEYEKAPTDERVVTEIKGWAVKTTDSNGNVVWTEAHPPIPADDTNQETIAQEYYNWNQQMEAKKATGDAVEITGQSNIPYKFLPKGDRSQHIVSVWINGKRRDYLINGNPRAAQAVNGMLNNESAKGALSAVNRFLAQSVTSWNPEFTLRNTVRDFGFASHLLEAKEGVNYWSKFEKHFFAMGLAPVGRTIAAKSMADVKNGLFVNLFKRYEQGTLDYNKPYHKWFAEFMDNGGMTGIATQQRFDEWKKKVVKDVAKMREGYMRHPWTLTKDIFSTIEVANEMAENITRFATFCASRESGRTAARSAYDAHEVSVNFNTRGSGNAVKTYSYEGMGGSAKALRNATGFFTGWMRNYTMFFNASVQSFCAFSRNIKGHPVRATATLMALPFAVGALMPWVNGLMQAWCDSDEDKKRLGIPDDPYGELPEYIRRDNLCFYIGKGEFVTVPLGIETRAFYGLGDLAAGYTFHPELQSQKNVAMDVAGQLSQIVPVGDFMSGSSFGDNAKGDAVTILNKFLPSMYTPLSELVFNIDWKGQPIMRDGDYLDNSPSWMRAPRGTLTPLVNLNKKVNADTNDIMPGNENMKGDEVLDAMTNPALIEHLLDSYVGGTGTFVKRTGKVVNRAIIKAQGGNADIESKDIPFVRSLLYTPSETNAMARTKAKWYKYKEDIEKDAANMKVLKRRDVPLDEQIANYAQLQKLQNNANAQRVNIYERASKQIKRLNKRKARAQDDEESKYFDQQVNMIMEDAVKEMDAIKEK